VTFLALMDWHHLSMVYLWWSLVVRQGFICVEKAVHGADLRLEPSVAAQYTEEPIKETCARLFTFSCYRDLMLSKLPKSPGKWRTTQQTVTP
jgi:hypothetical protein